MELKTVILPNIGNKLNCRSFIHIAKPIPKTVLESMLPVTFLVSDKENPDHKFEAELMDMVSYPVSGIPNFYAMLSHQLPADELKHFLMDSLKIASDELITVFLYIKK